MLGWAGLGWGALGGVLGRPPALQPRTGMLPAPPAPLACNALVQAATDNVTLGSMDPTLLLLSRRELHRTSLPVLENNLEGSAEGRPLELFCNILHMGC